MAALLTAAVAFAYPLPLLNASGTPYSIGRSIGTATSRTLRGLLDPRNTNATDLWSVLMPYCAPSGNGSECDALFASSRAAFPDAYDHLRGLADGANVPLRALMAFNCADEIHSLRGGFPHAGRWQRSACTALLDRRDSSTAVLAHNEDGGWCIAPPGGAFMLLARNRSHGAPPYVAMVYPAMLPGYAFAGIAASPDPWGYSVNSEFVVAKQVDVAAGGACNTFATHSLLGAKSAADAVALLASLRAATGFTANIVGFRGDTVSATNVEVGPGARDASVRSVRSGAAIFAHFNQYQRLNGSGVREYPDVSSDVRASRVASLCRDASGGNSSCDVLAVLGDEGSAPYNIWRDYSHRAVDHCMTLAAARLRFVGATASAASAGEGGGASSARSASLDVFTERPVGVAPRSQWSFALA